MVLARGNGYIYNTFIFGELSAIFSLIIGCYGNALAIGTTTICR